MNFSGHSHEKTSPPEKSSLPLRFASDHLFHAQGMHNHLYHLIKRKIFSIEDQVIMGIVDGFTGYLISKLGPFLIDIEYVCPCFLGVEVETIADHLGSPIQRGNQSHMERTGYILGNYRAATAKND